MCLMIYLASDKELPVISWDKNNSGFNIRKADETNVVKKYFSKKNLYHVGSYLGCGCGFIYGENLDDEDEEVLRRKSFEDFITYLKENIDDDGFEIYTSWAGDEWKEKEFEREIKLEEYVIPKSFSFREGEFIVVR